MDTGETTQIDECEVRDGLLAKLDGLRKSAPGPGVLDVGRRRVRHVLVSYDSEDILACWRNAEGRMVFSVLLGYEDLEADGFVPLRVCVEVADESLVEAYLGNREDLRRLFLEAGDLHFVLERPGGSEAFSVPMGEDVQRLDGAVPFLPLKGCFLGCATTEIDLLREHGGHG